MNIGSIVYRPAIQQTYVVVGIGENNFLQLKNLDNPSSEIVDAKRDWIMEYPTSWKYYDYYKFMAKNLVDKR